MPVVAADLASRVASSLSARNSTFEEFFDRAAPVIARTARAVAERFEHGGRLFAFGRGAAATDAQHVAVEFIHPVIVGKRALPAMDLSAFDPAGIAAMLTPADIVLVVSLDEDRSAADAVLALARDVGALVVTPLDGSATAGVAASHPFMRQELAEVWYHTLWESVHVFLERQQRGHDVGAAGFLYPYLGREQQGEGALLDDVAASIRAKVADDAALRVRIADTQSAAIASAIAMISGRAASGGTLLTLGNGGSATDANDFAFDCVSPPAGIPAIPAISLSSDVATITAIANDVGNDLIYVRQLIAHGRDRDTLFAVSTSGGSRNVIAALEEARRRGMPAIALLGYDGGEIRRRDLAGIAIVVDCDYIPRIQEVQASIYHVIRECMEGADGD